MTIVPKALPLWESHGKRYVHCRGGRAGGKTVAIAQRLVMHALEEPGTRILCVRHTEKSTTQSIKAELEDVIDAYDLRENFETRMSKEIRARNGSVILFIGLQDDPRSVKGFARCRICFVEEGDQILPREWAYLNPTIRMRGAILYIAMNPTNEDDALWYPFFKTEDESLPDPTLTNQTLYLEFGWEDLVGLVGPDGEPMLSPELVETIREEYRVDPEMAEHVWGGSLQIRTDALVFRRGRHWTVGTVGHATSGVEKVEVPVWAERRYGLDFAGLHTPAVGIRCRVWENRVHVEAESWRMRADDRLCREIADEIVDRHGAEIITDQNMALTAGLARRGGYSVRFARKGPDSVMAGVHWLRSRKVTVEPECGRLIRELSRWSMKVDPKTGQVKLPEMPETASKDAIDAVRYALDDEINGAVKPTSAWVPGGVRRGSRPSGDVSRFIRR